MTKKIPVQNSQGIKRLISAHCVICVALYAAGCSTASRAPAPSQSQPAESAEQLAPNTPRPNNDSAKKIESGSSQNQASYHFSMGQAFSLEGDSDKAIEEYKVALIYDPNSAVIHTRLAGEYVKKGLLTFAIEQCKIAVKLDPKYIDARLLLAGLYSSTKLVTEALEQYDAVLKIEPRNSEAYVFKGSLLLDEGRVNESINVLKTLVQKDAEYYLGYYYLGRAYQRDEKMELAIAAYKKALTVKPAFTQAGLALGLLLEEKKRGEEAVKIYEELYENAGDLQAVARLAQLYIDKEDYDRALKYLLLLNNADEDNLNVRVKIGLIYIERRVYDKAIDMFKSILEKNAEAEKVRYYLASVYEEQKQYDEAIEEFKRITPTSSVYIDAAIHVGHLYKLRGDMEQALRWTDEIISKNSNVPQFYIFKASLLEETRKVSDAVAALEKARDEFPKDEKILYYLGSLYDKLAKQEKALDLMNEILELNPDNVQALNYVGYSYVSRGVKLDTAEKMIKKALDLKPGDGYIQDSYGYLLLMRGNIRQATIELEKAFKLRPDEGVIVEHLGDAYLRANLKQKALQKYLDAAKLYNDPQEKEKVEKKIQELRRTLGSTNFDSNSSKNARQPAAER